MGWTRNGINSASTVVRDIVVNQCMLPMRRLGWTGNGTDSASNVLCDVLYSWMLPCCFGLMHDFSKTESFHQSLDKKSE